MTPIPPQSASLISVNVSTSATLQAGTRRLRTGIDKRPVAAPVHLGEQGASGDAVVNQRVHGGPDQAVYLYAADDLAWWSSELGQEILPGRFGENLTLSSFLGEPRIGDRYAIGPAVVELTAPRVPCATFEAAMGRRGWVKRFAQARRSGAYARVLQEAAVSAGDPVLLLARDEAAPAVVDAFDLYFAKPPDPAMVRRLLATPVSARLREILEDMAA